MKVNLERIDGKFHLKATNEVGRSVELDAGESDGGNDEGMRPMQMVLAALGGCSTIDVVLILEKMKQNLSDIKLEIEGKRAMDQTPKIFTDIHVHFKLYGDVDDNKAKRAIELSMDKYCSVGVMLRNGGVHITHSFEVFN